MFNRNFTLYIAVEDWFKKKKRNSWTILVDVPNSKTEYIDPKIVRKRQTNVT